MNSMNLSCFGGFWEGWGGGQKWVDNSTKVTDYEPWTLEQPSAALPMEVRYRLLAIMLGLPCLSALALLTVGFLHS